jgi:hypothetical protein
VRRALALLLLALAGLCAALPVRAALADPASAPAPRPNPPVQILTLPAAFSPRALQLLEIALGAPAGGTVLLRIDQPSTPSGMDVRTLAGLVCGPRAGQLAVWLADPGGGGQIGALLFGVAAARIATPEAANAAQRALRPVRRGPQLPAACEPLLAARTVAGAYQPDYADPLAYLAATGSPLFLTPQAAPATEGTLHQVARVLLEAVLTVAVALLGAGLAVIAWERRRRRRSRAAQQQQLESQQQQPEPFEARPLVAPLPPAAREEPDAPPVRDGASLPPQIGPARYEGLVQRRGNTSKLWVEIDGGSHEVAWEGATGAPMPQEGQTVSIAQDAAGRYVAIAVRSRAEGPTARRPDERPR